ncbi:hypothetical protein ABD07_00925 [Nitrosomonas oligotropha]|nr:hypothetical protein [Nitrosomonas oligotropha]
MEIVFYIKRKIFISIFVNLIHDEYLGNVVIVPRRIKMILAKYFLALSISPIQSGDFLTENNKTFAIN